MAATPSVSASTIWRALWAAGSPLADNNPRRDGKTFAEYLWDQGKRSGIDPAVVMAIFRQESRYGTRGMAVLTHDLANMRPVANGPVRCSDDGCYAYEKGWFDGIDNIYKLLRWYTARGYVTVDDLIPAWAPPSDDNDVAVFANCVHETLSNLQAAG